MFAALALALRSLLRVPSTEGVRTGYGATRKS